MMQTHLLLLLLLRRRRRRRRHALQLSAASKQATASVCSESGSSGTPRRSSYYSAPGMGREYCDEHVCLCVRVSSVCVCLPVREHISGTTRPVSTKFCAFYQWP